MKLDRFLVCGLGSLGQHCILALKEFGVKTIAIDLVSPKTWELPKVANLVDDLIIGDCRQNDILHQAQILQCRAALIVTNNEQVNTETALVIRQINPHTRLVVRSSKTNLNELLSRQLGNFIAYEPIELPAQSFTLATLGNNIAGLFNIDGQWMRVIQEDIDRHHPWLHKRTLWELNTRTCKILAHARDSSPLPQRFYQWEGREKILLGDKIVYIESAENILQQPFESPHPQKTKSKINYLKLWIQTFQEQVRKFWQFKFQERLRRLVILYGLVILVLLPIGTMIYKHYYPQITYPSAFLTNIVLLLGGYGDVFGGNLLQPIDPHNPPLWVKFFSLALTLLGTVLVGILYGFLTETLLSRKFQLLQRRPPIPKQNHVVVVGLGRVGQRVATLLQQFKQPLVGISLNANDHILPDIPMVFGDLVTSLRQSNIATSKSVAIVTDDEILNLEIALMVQEIDPHINLIIRTSGQRLSQHLMTTLPNTKVLGMYHVAAEVFAGAAFGENIINLFHCNQTTILVTEYQIEADDHLQGLLIGEIAYGYEIVPISHQRPTDSSPTIMPKDDIILTIGDRLVVLATLEGLQRVEIGKQNDRNWYVRVEKALNNEAIFEGANIIGRISGCSLTIARELMNNLPGMLPIPLYKPQAERLVHALNKVLVQATIHPR